MQIPELQKAIKMRGDAAKIARYAGVSESTIGRIIGGMRPNPGIQTIEKIKAACARLEKERSKKTDKKQKQSRKSSEPATAKASA